MSANGVGSYERHLSFMLGNENTAITMYTNKLCLQIHRGSKQTESRAALLEKKILMEYISVCFKCLS